MSLLYYPFADLKIHLTLILNALPPVIKTLNFYRMNYYDTEFL